MPIRSVRPSAPASAKKTVSAKSPHTSAYHHGDLANALLAGTEKLVAERGVSGVSLREVARRSGVSHAAAYRHFPSKLAVLAALALSGMAALADYLERVEHAASNPGTDSMGAITTLMEAYVRLALGRPARFRVMFAAELAHKSVYPLLRNASDRAAAPLSRMVHRATQDGRIRPSEEAATAVALWSLVHGVSVLAIDHQLDEGLLHVTAPKELDSYLRLVRHGASRLLR
jgi:AcrR family transcriptional regulator